MHQEGPLLLCLLTLLRLSSTARTLLVPGLLLLCKFLIQCREASAHVSRCCCPAVFYQRSLWSFDNLCFPYNSLQHWCCMCAARMF